MLLTYSNVNKHTGTISSVYKYNYSLDRNVIETQTTCAILKIGDIASNTNSLQLMARYVYNYNKLQLNLKSMKQKYISIIIGI